MNALSQIKELLSNRHEVARLWKAKGKPVIGWNCSYIPEEVIYALDALPVVILGDTQPTKMANVHLPTNSCSFARSCLNSALRGDYDYLDGFVTSNSCDNRNKIWDMWKYHVKIPYIYFLNTPHTQTEKTLKYFHEEILKFKVSLETAFGQEISQSALKKAIQSFNENRLLLKQTYALRKLKPPLISGVEALEIVLSSMVLPKDEHNKLLKQLLSGLYVHSEKPEGGARLLVAGSIMDTTKLIEIIEAAGGSVVADDWCVGSRYFWNVVGSETDPLWAITKRYLNKIPSSFMMAAKERFDHTIEMAKEFDVEGVVFFVLKFCDTHLFDIPQLVEELKASLGLPVLVLEWDHSLGGLAQLKTRIEAFLEMLRGVE